MRINCGLSLVNECVNNPSVPGAWSKKTFRYLK